MIEFLKGELKANRLNECTVYIAGKRGGHLANVIAVDHIGIVMTALGKTFCVPWRFVRGVQPA